MHSNDYRYTKTRPPPTFLNIERVLVSIILMKQMNGLIDLQQNQALDN
jgi:hypothetical protein